MLRDAVEESVGEVDPAVTWMNEHHAAVEPRWRTVDRALRAINQRRAALDADEARWLREAEALQIVRTQAKAALTGLGWKPAIAAAAVAAAAAAHGAEVALERLIFEALRRCPGPKA